MLDHDRSLGYADVSFEVDSDAMPADWLMVGLDVGVVRDAAKAASPLFSSAQAGIPLGFGLDVPLTWHVSLGAEATYHFQLGESYSLVKTNGIDGGDLSTFNLVARVRL
jgi:hypothetical protein